MPASVVDLLYLLARRYGVQTSYTDMSGRQREPTVEVLISLLRSLGAPVASVDDVVPALRQQRQFSWRQVVQPVLVAWEGGPLTAVLRLPSDKANGLLSGRIVLETGDELPINLNLAEIPVVTQAEVEGVVYVLKKLTVPKRLPLGYHRLILELEGQTAESLIIAAPVKAYTPEQQRAWGVFLPLYALHSKKSWGAGDFSDLETLTDWVGCMGGNVVATLPFLATMMGENSVPSPYAPSSRLLWNEFYLDVTKLPEYKSCVAAQELVSSGAWQSDMQESRQSSLVDYQRQMALKRRVLEEMCRSFFGGEPQGRGELARFVGANPAVSDYARFTATAEKRRDSWWTWPERQRGGMLGREDYDEDAMRYHLYAQWLTYRQFQGFSERLRQKDSWLYLDLPLGVHPDGYDTWRNQETFALDASTGAPSDPIFTKGQNWGFPPPHPEKTRRTGYRYTIAYLQHHLRHAGMLRIDHVMGLHRLFWIPKGADAAHGVYVNYHADELYAILCLESVRNKCFLVGEDLGIVPPVVRPAMAKHGLQRMYVLHFEMASNAQAAIRPPPADSVAGLNTHDMFPFASTWQDKDIPERVRLGQLTEDGAYWEREGRRKVREALVAYLHENGWLKERTDDTELVLEALFRFLADSPARVILVNLEDLALESHPQNVPGTFREYPNWRHKAQFDLETLCQMPDVVATLKEIDSRRRQRAV